MLAAFRHCLQSSFVDSQGGISHMTRHAIGCVIRRGVYKACILTATGEVAPVLAPVAAGTAPVAPRPILSLLQHFGFLQQPSARWPRTWLKWRTLEHAAIELLAASGQCSARGGHKGTECDWQSDRSLWMLPWHRVAGGELWCSSGPGSNFTYHNQETMLCTIDPYYGNLNQTP